MKSKIYLSLLSFSLFFSCGESKKQDVIEKKQESSAAMCSKDGELTKEITLTGEVKHPLTITVDSLKKMNVFEGGELQLVCQSGENKKKINNFKGVLLKDILQKAVVNIENHKENGRYVVLITSTNNYAVSYVEISAKQPPQDRLKQPPLDRSKEPPQDRTKEPPPFLV